MNYLVLGGGNLRGAWMAGRLHRLALAGYVPQAIVGTSIGAVLAATLGYDKLRGRTFLEATDALVQDFLVLTGPKDVVTKRSVPALAFDLLRGRWQGLYSLEPLRRRLTARLHTKQDILHPDIDDAAVVTVNLATGGLHVSTARVNSVIASASEPIIAAPTWIDNGTPMPDCLVDGGVRSILPLGYAIDQGATAIQAVVTTPDPVLYPQKRVLPDGLFEQIGATLGAITEHQVDQEIRMTKYVNHMVTSGSPWKAEHRVVTLAVERPTTWYRMTMAAFTAADVYRMVTDGLEGR